MNDQTKRNILLTMKNLIILGVFCLFLTFSLATIYKKRTKEFSKFEAGNSSHIRWTCKKDTCHKSKSSRGVTLETCQMMCSTMPPLWPKPKLIDIIHKNSSAFLREHIFLKIHSPIEVKGWIEEAANLFLDSLKTGSEYRLYDEELQVVKLNIHVGEGSSILNSATNEGYTLYSQKHPDHVLVNIFAKTYFGARNAIETLSQLIWHDSLLNRFRILHDIKVDDEPSFNHRGVLIDISRHYFPLDLLKKAIDGMAASKLNVLHIHATDVDSFPLDLPHNKKLALNGAYDYDLIYSSEDIVSLVNYAKKRGIRTIIEIDAPSHISPEAWPQDEILCNISDVFKTTLNPDNPETLESLKSIYADLFQLGTDTETFHLGDDEVVVDCWKDTDSAKKEKGNLYLLWVNFTNNLIESVKVANNGTLPKNIVIWSSPLTDKYLTYLSYPHDLVVQYWFGDFKPIIDQGYKIIFSTVGHWYLDCGFGPWRKNQENGACDPYTDWKKFYKYRPWKDYSNRLNQVLGGEVCLWSEQISVDDLETRLWPRSAAFAERMWSDPEVFDQDDVFRRIDFHSRGLKQRGFRVAAIWPQYCSLFPKKC